MSKKVATGILAAAVVVGGIWYVLSLHREPVAPELQSLEIPEGAHVVTLTKGGFSPSELIIRKGETVTFRTTGEDLYWPASNLHPSHGIYPEFDPKQPVQPNAVWSFTFENGGEWKYHDHLAPYFTGVITVTE